MKAKFFAVAAFTVIAASSFAALTWSVGPEINPGMQFIQMHGSAICNGYLYAIGGNTGLGTGTAQDSDKIYYTPLTSPLGAFTTCTATLPHSVTTPTDPDYAYIEREVASYNGRIYIAGGNSNGADSERNQVTIITPSANGDIQPSGIVVSDATGSPISRFEHATVIDQSTGKLYVIGGGSPTRVTEIDVAQIAADGSVGAFTVAGNLATGVGQAGAVILGGKLYVIAGYVAAAVATVQHATINSDGTLGAFSATDTALPEARFDVVSVVYNGKIYTIAGCTTGNAATKKNVYVATVDGSGNITGWTDDGSMTIQPTGGTTANTGLRRHSAVALDSYGIVVPGGRIDGTNWTDDVFVGKTVVTNGVSDWSLFE